MTQQSSISLKAQRHQDTVVLNITPTGHPTDADFDKLSAMLETAVYSIQSSRIALLVDLSDLQSMSAKSAWKELAQGSKIGFEFDRIAVLGQRRWQNLLISTMSWLISPNLKVFKRKEEATNWVMAS